MALLSVGVRFLLMTQMGVSGSAWALFPGGVLCVGLLLLLFAYDGAAAAINRVAVARRAAANAIAVVPGRAWFACVSLWLAWVPEIATFVLLRGGDGYVAGFVMLMMSEIVVCCFTVVAFASYRSNRCGFGVVRPSATGDVVWYVVGRQADEPILFRVGALEFRDGGVRFPFAPQLPLSAPEMTPEELVVCLGGAPVRAAPVNPS